MGTLWALNLDAEDELRAHRSGRHYAPGRLRIPERAFSAAAALLRPGDRVLGSPAGEPLERGAAWCPTASARSALESVGARTAPAPSMDVLVLANARETFAGLNPLPGSALAANPSELERALAKVPLGRAPSIPQDPAWVLRASLCSAGRVRLVVPGPSPAAEDFGRRAFASGPVHVQPFVDIVEELSLHGVLLPDGGLLFGSPVRQEARAGTFAGATLATGLAPSRVAALESALVQVADRLAGIGYFGPFGVDAFVWKDSAGVQHLQAPSEVNARFSMAFALGAPACVEAAMGPWR